MASLPAALALGLAFSVFRLLPLDAASALGGRIGRLVGPRLKWHRIAKANLERVWPEHSVQQRDEILMAMWDNLGRNLAEYPWLGSKKLMQRIDLSSLPEVLPSNAIFAAGHLGNWELAPLAGHLLGLPLTLIYRRINNPLIESMIYRLRRPYCAGLYPSG
jgi:KDO2-lipid IV(A) lauroyltransferase